MNKHVVNEHYKQINAQTGVVDADPHRLIQMLYVGALEQISVAKGCMQREDFAGKGMAIGKAIEIVGGLSASVNRDVKEFAIAENLYALYEFVTANLTRANIENSTQALDESARVLHELQDGWNAIRPEALKGFEEASTGAV